MRSKAMLSTEFCSSDAFLDLTFEAQALYVQLNCQADGIGAVDGVRRIMRGCGASQSAFDELADAGLVVQCQGEGDEAWFILDFWVHNRHDRCNFAPGRHYELACTSFEEVEECTGRYRFRSVTEASSLKPDCAQSLMETNGSKQTEAEANSKEPNGTESKGIEGEGAEGGTSLTAPCPECGQVCAVAKEGHGQHLWCPDCGDFMSFDGSDFQKFY